MKNLAVGSGNRKMGRFLWVAIVALGLAAVSGSSTLADTTVTLNLGQSNQNYDFYGITVNSGLGYWFVQQGTCGTSGGNTRCDLTGNFTGSTPGFTSGTYDLVTTYTGTAPFPIPELVAGPTPILGVSTSVGASTFTFFDFGEDNTAMTLDLVSGGTDYAIPIVGGNNWLNNPQGFNLAGAPGAFCTGLPGGVPCSNFNVAANGNASGTGAEFQGEVTGTIAFQLSSATPVGTSSTPEPGSLLLMGGGCFAMAGALRRKLLK